MIKKIFCSIIIASSFLIKNSYAQIQEDKSLNLSLQECIEISLKNNLELKIESYNPVLKDLSLQKIWDGYGISLGFQPRLRQNIRPSSTSFISGATILNEMSHNYDFFVTKNFLTGGDVTVNFQNSVLFTNSTRTDLNPAITPRLFLSFSQPILRNAFNGYKYVDIGENDTINARYSLKSKAIDIASRTQDAYWDLVLTKERLNVLERSLQLAKELLVINKEKEKSGFMAKIDILTTEANIAAKEEGILQVKRSLGNSEDRLKRLLNPLNNKIDWDTSIQTIDKPEFNIISTDFEVSMKKAIENRPDYLSLLIDLKSAELNKDISKQNRLPQLNLSGNVGLESLDDSYATSVGKLFEFQTYFWNVGVTFELPVVGNVNETTYQENIVKQKRQEEIIVNTKQRIITEIRQAIRNIEINKKRVEANRISKRLAEEQVKAETEKLNLGLSTNFQVLQFQKNFEEASLNEVNALIDYIKSLNELSALEGLLLEKNNIMWVNINEK